eukprot:2390094-Prymnesium_polylepis.1
MPLMLLRMGTSLLWVRISNRHHARGSTCSPCFAITLTKWLRLRTSSGPLCIAVAAARNDSSLAGVGIGNSSPGHPARQSVTSSAVPLLRPQDTASDGR